MCGWHAYVFLECCEAEILKIGGLLLITPKNQPLLPITGYLRHDQALHIINLLDPLLDCVNVSWSFRPWDYGRENLGKAAVLNFGLGIDSVLYKRQRSAINLACCNIRLLDSISSGSILAAGVWYMVCVCVWCLVWCRSTISRSYALFLHTVCCKLQFSDINCSLLSSGCSLTVLGQRFWIHTDYFKLRV